MNEVFYTVQVGDCDRKFREGTTYLDIAKEYQHEYEHDIVLVFVDGRLQELFKTCLLYTSPSPRDGLLSRMPSSA